MKRELVSLTLVLAAVCSVGPVLNSQKLRTEGQAWLERFTEAPAVNVNGAWRSDDWGLVTLKHADGSRDVTGTGDGWEITGVVSGNKLYLLFCDDGEINYSAILEADGPKRLTGSYAKPLFTERARKRPMVLER